MKVSKLKEKYNTFNLTQKGVKEVREFFKEIKDLSDDDDIEDSLIPMVFGVDSTPKPSDTPITSPLTALPENKDLLAKYQKAIKRGEVLTGNPLSVLSTKTAAKLLGISEDEVQKLRDNDELVNELAAILDGQSVKIIRLKEKTLNAQNKEVFAIEVKADFKGIEFAVNVSKADRIEYALANLAKGVESTLNTNIYNIDKRNVLSIVFEA